MDLEGLLLDLNGKSEQEIERIGKDKYEEVYLERGKVIGVFELYKGGEVVFHRDQYAHAFYTSPDRIRHQFRKNKIAEDRVARILWIREILTGRVPGTQCWHVHPVPDLPHRDRLYVVWRDMYIIRLSLREDGKSWSFKTAYKVGRQDIKRYTRGGTLSWEIPENKTPRD